MFTEINNNAHLYYKENKGFFLQHFQRQNSLSTFKGQGAEEFDLLWMTNGSGIGVQRFSWPDPTNSP